MDFNNVIRNLPKYFGQLSGISIFLIMILTSADVVMRYFFKNPLIWVAEWSEYLMVSVVYLGLAYTDTLGGHIGIDLFVQKLSKKTRHILNYFNHTLMLAFVIVLTWQGWVLFEDSWRLNRHHMGASHTPEFPANFALFIGCVVFCITLLVKIIRINRGRLQNSVQEGK